jgi:hypothetical protein
VSPSYSFVVIRPIWVLAGPPLALAASFTEYHCVRESQRGAYFPFNKAGQLLTQIGEALRTSKQIGDR